ncbi:MAG: hypothetical protein ABSE42_16140 [Bryobacteraceae bacterium]
MSVLGAAFGLAIVWIWAQPAVSPGGGLRPASASVSAEKPAVSEGRPAGALATLATLETEERMLELRMQAQQQLLENERERLAALDSTARFMMTLVGVFAFLLGAMAWKTVDDQRKSAEKNLEIQLKQFEQTARQQLGTMKADSDKALNDIESLRQEIHAEFPMFGRMKKNFGRTLHELQLACGNLRALDETYTGLTWDERQRVGFYERAMASSVLLDTREFNNQMSEIYRLLGVFYGSRYAVAVMAKDANAPPNRGHFERARFYFDRSIDANNANYLSYAHAGLFTSYYRDREAVDAARDYFTRAAEIGMQKQMPLINLAIIELNAGNAAAALKHLERARGRAEYQEDGSAPQPDTVDYLKACALALQGATTADGSAQRSLYAESLKLLRRATEHRDPWVKATFLEGDYQCKPDGEAYFSGIATDSALAEEYRDIVVRLRGPAVPSPEAIADAGPASS